VSSTRHALVEDASAGTSGQAGDAVARDNAAARDEAAARGEAATRGDTVAGCEPRGRVSARDRAGVGVGPGRTPDAGSPAGGRATGRGAGAGRSPIGGGRAGGRAPGVGRSASRHVTVGGGGRRRLLAVGIALAAGYLVAACTGGGEPDPTPPVETSAAPSPTPTPEPTETGPTKPDRPAAMDRDDAEGAAAAAEYFLELYPYVMSTGDTSEWDAMSHAECGTCASLITQARTIAERGDVAIGGEVTATVEDPSRYVRDESTGLFPLDLDFHQAGSSIADAEGTEIFAAEAKNSQKRVEMGRLNGDWIVVTIGEMSN